MYRKNRKNNLSNFLFFTVSILLITSFFITLLTVKNECLKTQLNIQQLHKLQASSYNTVKELQSNKEYLSSKERISEILSNEFITIAPETLLININGEQ